MKFTLRLPTDQYAYIEQEVDVEGPQEAVEAYRGLQEAWKGGAGLGMKGLAKVIHEYCKTGAIVDGGDYDFSTNERLLLGELKKLIRN